MINKGLRVLLALPAILFLVTGLRWLTDPTAAAGQLGMPLLEGVGRSSQMGDVGGLFLSMGLMILLAIVTARRSWFYAPALMLSLIAFYRILAWILHDASLPVPMVIVEVVVAAMLLLVSRRLSEKE